MTASEMSGAHTQRFAEQVSPSDVAIAFQTWVWRHTCSVAVQKELNYRLVEHLSRI